MSLWTLNSEVATLHWHYRNACTYIRRVREHSPLTPYLGTPPMGCFLKSILGTEPYVALHVYTS